MKNNGGIEDPLYKDSYLGITPPLPSSHPWSPLSLTFAVAIPECGRCRNSHRWFCSGDDLYPGADLLNVYPTLQFGRLEAAVGLQQVKVFSLAGKVAIKLIHCLRIPQIWAGKG